MVAAVAAVDDEVAVIEQFGELVDHLCGDAGGDHHPYRAWLVQCGDEIGQCGRADRALGGERLDGGGGRVEHHRLMAVVQDSPNDVGAHPTEPDHSELHSTVLFDSRRRAPR